jgi:hypothetical protein
VPDPPLSRRRGDARANRVRERFAEVFGDCPVPVPVEEIAEDLLGLRLCRGALPLSGLLIVGRRELWTREAEPPERRRFTVAHEIGHWVCHREAGPRVCDLTSARAARDPLEREANTFAAELLMPAAEVRAAHARHPDPGSLAEWFRVSREAMGWRLYNLALGPPPTVAAD